MQTAQAVLRVNKALHQGEKVSRFKLSNIISALALMILFMAASAAQSTFGSFLGTVRDPSGSVVADCVVTLTNKGTSAQRTTTTDKDGGYVLVNIEPGSYEITMTAPGFQPANFTNLQLLSRQTVRVDGTVNLATQVESVNVTGTTEAVITTEVSNIAETKTGRELFDLPVAIGSRATGSTSALSTLTTQAGVQTDNAGKLSVAGSKPSMLSISVDGISSMNVRTTSAIDELFPSFGSIAEIRVSEINNSAEFGGVSDITTVSKSGTNSWHGGLFENLQNTELNARNPFSSSKTKVQMNNYGAYVGGPVVIPHLYNGKDKTFMFGSYEGLQLPRQTFVVQSVPSLALRSGDLSAYTAATIRDPLTGIPFANKQIPIGRISPVALNALKYLWPLPNTGAPNAIANNYTNNMSTPISSNQGDIRIDQNISTRQTMFVRGTYKDRSVVNAPTALQTIMAGGVNQPERDYALTISHNFVFTPRLVNELRAGLSDFRQYTTTSFDGLALTNSIGVPVPDPPSGNTSPVFNITGFQQTGSAASAVSRSKTLQLIDSITWNSGSHTIKAGGDIRMLSAYFANVFAANRAGQYTFNGQVTNSLIGSPYAAFLLGIPDRTGVGSVRNGDTGSKATHYAAYVQDDWKATPRLTINFGMRWEYHPPFVDYLNNLAVFVPDVSTVVNGTPVNGMVVVADGTKIHPLFAASIAPTPIYENSQVGYPKALHSSQKTSFAPRVGFAWRPFADGKTVIRGGYGKFIETMLGTLAQAGWGIPTSYVANFTNTITNGTPTLTMPYPFPSDLTVKGVQDFRTNAVVHYRDPYVQQWNLTVERDLGLNIGLRVSYDGNHGSNIGVTENLNQVPANTVGFNAIKASAPFPIWSRMATETNRGRSNYNALTLAVNKRMSHGLQFSANYSFAKNLSNGQGFNPTAFATQQGGVVSDRYNIDLDYGNVTFTRRHRFLTTFLYELPFGQKGMLLKGNKLVDRIVGGWQLSGVAIWQTGPFMTAITQGADPAGTNFPSLEGSGSRVDRVANVPLYPENQGISGWFNPAAFAVPGNNIGRFGNLGVGTLVGPGSSVLSLSLFKSVDITESIKFQIGGAASNVLNHPNYLLPGNMTLGTSGFGSITNVQTQEAGGPRALQLSARLTF